MPRFTHPVVEQIPSLRRYARALTGGKVEDADDLVQDTLERAHAKWHLWRADSELRPWLFSIMHNLFVNQVRSSRNRQAFTSLDDALELGTPAGQEGRIEAQDVLAGVGRLAPELREVLILVSVEDLTYAEAAKALAIPIGTVMSRLARARAQLRQMMEGGQSKATKALRLVQ